MTKMDYQKAVRRDQARQGIGQMQVEALGFISTYTGRSKFIRGLKGRQFITVPQAQIVLRIRSEESGREMARRRR